MPQTGQELNTLIESSAAMLELEQNARAQESTQAANHLASNQANHQAHIEALSQAQARADRRAAEVLAVEQAKTAAEKTKVCATLCGAAFTANCISVLLLAPPVWLSGAIRYTCGPHTPLLGTC